MKLLIAIMAFFCCLSIQVGAFDEKSFIIHVSSFKEMLFVIGTNCFDESGEELSHEATFQVESTKC